jgi:hypothetical protein
MTGAADGQKLGQSLNDSKKDGLKDAHHESIQKTVIRTLGGHGDRVTRGHGEKSSRLRVFNILHPGFLIPW